MTMKNNTTIGFIGGGRITHLILTAWKHTGDWPDRIVVSDPDAKVLHKLKKDIPEIIAVESDNKKTAEQEYIFIAVHPPVLMNVLSDIKGVIKQKSIIISLAPKIKIDKIQMALNGHSKIVRMIPNAPSIINLGYNPVCYSPTVNNEEKKLLGRLFQNLGQYPTVAEDKLEAYAIISAMGPTYFWFQMDELYRLGLSFGLSDQELKITMEQMITGAAKTLFTSSMSYEEVTNLIPVKPLTDDENTIRDIYHSKLNTLYQKLKS